MILATPYTEKPSEVQNFGLLFQIDLFHEAFRHSLPNTRVRRMAHGCRWVDHNCDEECISFSFWVQDTIIRMIFPSLVWGNRGSRIVKSEGQKVPFMLATKA